MNKHYTSIIIASYITNELRERMFRTSLVSLIDTVRELPVEIIVVDNGGSEFAKEFAHIYIKNKENMHFGIARNQGRAVAQGNFICIADNDISYHFGWLEACWKVLDLYPRKKLWATPIQYPTGFIKERYDKGTIAVELQDYWLNTRAGSNCFVMRKNDFDEVGPFYAHRIAGSKWNDLAVRKGYCAAVTPENMCDDLGLRLGYNLNDAVPIKRTLTNGEQIYFNVDEYQLKNPDKDYFTKI